MSFIPQSLLNLPDSWDYYQSLYYTTRYIYQTYVFDKVINHNVKDPWLDSERFPKRSKQEFPDLFPGLKICLHFFRILCLDQNPKNPWLRWKRRQISRERKSKSWLFTVGLPSSGHEQNCAGKIFFVYFSVFVFILILNFKFVDNGAKL